MNPHRTLNIWLTSSVCIHRPTVMTESQISDETCHFVIKSRIYRPLVVALPKYQDSPELRQCLKKKHVTART